MEIFIDESGAFALVPPNRARFCAVTAVAIAQERLPCLVEQFVALRATWNRGGAEVKGSKLTECQMAQALRLFRAYDLSAFAAVIDTEKHPFDTLRWFRDEQARRVLNVLKGLLQPHPQFIEVVKRDAERWRTLSDPLTMQLCCFTAVVEDVIHGAPSYLSTRAPKELAAFHWTLDAKGRDGPTDSESLWRDLLCPTLQTTFLEEPVGNLKTFGGDYSHFDRVFGAGTTMPDHLRAHPKRRQVEDEEFFDLKTLMLTHLRFQRSDADAGLQIADIVGSALTRALNESIAWDGWGGLGRLFIRDTGLRQISLGPDESGPPVPVEGIAERVFRGIDGRAKPMFPTGWQVPRG